MSSSTTNSKSFKEKDSDSDPPRSRSRRREEEEEKDGEVKNVTVEVKVVGGRSGGLLEDGLDAALHMGLASTVSTWQRRPSFALSARLITVLLHNSLVMCLHIFENIESNGMVLEYMRERAHKQEFGNQTKSLVQRVRSRSHE